MLNRLRRIPKPLLIAAAVAACVGLALAWAFRGELPGAVTWGRDRLAEAVQSLQALGPVGYYGGFLVLASLGAPASVFVVAGAAAFGPAVGILGALAVLVACATVTHFMALHVIEALALRILARFGKTILKVPPQSRRTFALVFRLTPGMPFFVQNLALPLAGVPLSLNLALLVPIQVVYVSGFVFLGDAFMSGKAGRAVLGIALLVVAGAFVHWLRTRNAARTSPTAAAS